MEYLGVTDFLSLKGTRIIVTTNRATISNGEHELFKQLGLFGEPNQVQLMNYIDKLRNYKERFDNDMPAAIRKEFLKELKMVGDKD